MDSGEIFTDDYFENTKRNLISLATGIAALIFYLLMLSPTAFPGSSASLVLTCLGLEPQLIPAHPLWMSCIYPARFLPAGATVYALNLWSAVCGALSVALLFRYLSRWIQKRIVFDGCLNDRTPHLVSLAAGLSGSIAFATSLPLFAASTRLSVISFHALLLLIAFNLLQDNQDRGDRWRPFALALLCGAGCAESALFLLMTPFFIVMLLLTLYKRKQATWGRIAGLALTGLLGTTIYGWSATHFAGTEGFSLAGYPGRRAVVGRVLMMQMAELREFLPQSGWIFVLILVFLPWLAIQFEARRGLNRRCDAAELIFHLVLIFLVLPVQFNSSALPWAATLPLGRLPVLEMLLTSMTLGYLVSFWLLGFMDPPDVADDYEVSLKKREDNAKARKSLQITAGVIASVLAVLITMAAVSNAGKANGRAGRFADSYVRSLLNQLKPGSWLITDGLIDNNARLVARERGQEIQMINLSMERSPLQIKKLCKMIETDPGFQEGKARYVNAARLGGAAFLQEWLTSDPDAAARVAFYAPPDLLFEAGLFAQVDCLIFKGVQELESLKSRPLLEEHQKFWEDMEKILPAPDHRSPLHSLQAALRRHVSLAANNLGVLLEDLERPEEAYAAYMRALDFDPDNFSAMLNRVVLTRKGVKPLDAEIAEIAASEALKELKQRPSSSRLARFYGYVRVPGEFSRQSSEWMRFGQPKMAEINLKRAISLAPGDQKKQFLGMLAALHLSNSRPDKSEAALLDVLQISPADPQALLGMVSVSNMRRDHEAARKWLSKAADAGVSETQLNLEYAKIEIAEGNYVQAQQRLHQITDANPSFLEAWALQANLLLEQNKADVAERDILPRMKSLNPDKTPYVTAVTEAYILKAKGASFYEPARERFLLALRIQPGSRLVLSEILKLDYALRDQKASEQHAAAMLRLDRNDALANYIMGTLLIDIGDLPGAEEHLRRSATSSPSVPVLNDLAEVLRMQGKLDEAEHHIRRALELDPKSPFALDTLACILIDADRIEEARQASDAALALAPQALPMKITAVRILALRGGDKVEGREMLRQINQYAEQLSPQQRAQLESVTEALKNR